MSLPLLAFLADLIDNDYHLERKYIAGFILLQGKHFVIYKYITIF